MENKLYGAIKDRMFRELDQSIQRHPAFAKHAEAYNKLHMGKERPQAGVMLESASASRLHLSPDDCIGDLTSLVTLATAGDSPGTTIEWAWEDVYNLTPRVEKENVSGTLDPSGRFVTVNHTPITAGPQNLNKATNFGQIKLYINGVEVRASFIDADSGKVVLPSVANPSDVIEVSYYYSDVDRPGYYFIEHTGGYFQVTPLYSEFDEVVISNTSGVETNAQLANTPVLIDYILNLYTKKNHNSTVVYLERGTEYTVDVTGNITFLEPLQRGTTLYASYRWQGANRGPFPVSGQNKFFDKIIKGVVLAVGTRAVEGDKQVVILTPNRERVAHVKGGHYILNLNYKVFARDPESAHDLADHLASDIWSERKEALKWEGITLQECMAESESVDIYDDATQAVYFQNDLNMEIMSEWKKFIPYVARLSKYNMRVQMYADVSESTLEGASYDIVIDMPLKPHSTPLEVVKHPQTGYPRYI